MDFNTPVGRLVQGSVIPQQQKDMDTNQPLTNADGSPVMGTFIALAFPKILPNGQPNAEFDAFHAQLKQVAAQAWPALFPQGANGPCTNPRFSWKVQDGDGHDQSGRTVADKPGFAGHWIVKFYTAFPMRCFNEGKFAPHEEIQNPADVIKRGYWVRVFGEVKSNNATGTQVPGISLYPKLLSFVERGEEIASGPDAEQAFSGSQPSWRPAAPAGSPVPSPGAAPAAPQVTPPAVSVPQVTPPAVSVPQVPQVPQAPAAVPDPPAGPQVSPALAAQGITWEALKSNGWTEEAARAQGHIL